MTRPNIQIGDEVREMTDEEFAEFETLIANPSPLTEPPNE